MGRQHGKVLLPPRIVSERMQGRSESGVNSLGLFLDTNDPPREWKKQYDENTRSTQHHTIRHFENNRSPVSPHRLSYDGCRLRRVCRDTAKQDGAKWVTLNHATV